MFRQNRLIQTLKTEYELQLSALHSQLQERTINYDRLKDEYETLNNKYQLLETVLTDNDILDIQELIRILKTPTSAVIEPVVVTSKILEKVLDIPCEVMLAMAWRESRIQATATKYERGIRYIGMMQVSQGVWDTHAKRFERVSEQSPVWQFAIGALYLSHNKRKRGSLFEGVRAYNGGNKKTAGVLYAKNVLQHAEELKGR